MATRKKEIRADESISAYGTARSTVEGAPLSPGGEKGTLTGAACTSDGHALPQGQPLPRTAKVEHTKPSAGPCGSDAGQAFTYVHFNR